MANQDFWSDETPSERLIKALLTTDGLGKAPKTEALSRLLERAAKRGVEDWLDQHPDARATQIP